MPELDANGNPIVDPNDKGGTPPPQVTPPDNDGKDKGGKDDDKDKTVPSYRLKEESDKRRLAEEELAKYKKKEADDLDAKKKADEAEALKKGEHETVIKSKDQEIDGYKQKETSWAEKDSKIKVIVDQKLADFEKTHGKEALDKAITIIGSEDPRVIMEKLDSVEAIMGGEKKPPVGGSKDTPGTAGGSEGIKFYQDKLDKGEKLSAQEEADYFKLLNL